MSFTPAPGHHGPWVHPQRRTRARPRATTSPPPVFEISTRNCFSPLRETERDAVIIGDSIVRHVRATLAEGKVHTHCLPGARVLDVSAQIPAILKADESPRVVVLHAGVNDTTQRQTETLKRDFRSLIETVRSTTPAATIIVSGPLPTYRRGHERFSRLFALNEWLLSWCKERNCSLLIIGIFSGSDLGFFALMACTPAESERSCSRTTSPGLYAPFDYFSLDPEHLRRDDANPSEDLR
uniref:SGNH hydrolase-type esterase domain-containing protein n=1 Tax=Cyprinus carpio carpio TaxID=630221 RepID=A0A9J7YWY1_CYPCA